jgi:D-sedoheptulose 7-phosphate isomerase
MHSNVFFEEVIKIAESIDIIAIEKLAQEISELRKRKGRLFFIGVGGSAANCSHAVNDFRKLCGVEAYAPTDNVSELTARINDEGWETVFAAWLKVSNANEDDAVFVFSVGGGN